ncbi:MAG: glycosyltransferase [Candidatus Omnitrophica bacterium]|nr:glycosyltransferase [Candidatus Omnitrophota bacterium]
MTPTFISIIIPAFNDSKGLRATLDSLLALTYPRDRTELIIIDNNSTDGTFEAAVSYRDKYSSLIKSEKETSRQSSYAARNKGISLASGEIIVFLDADMTVAPDFLDRINAFFNTTGAEYAGYDVRILTGDKPNIYELYDKLNAFPVKGYLEARHFAPTCALAVNKRIFDKTGSFDSTLGSSGDYEFGNRAHNKGIKQHFVPDITVYHPARATLSSHFSKAIRIGKGRSVVRSKGIKLSYEPGKEYYRYGFIKKEKDTLALWDSVGPTKKLLMIILSKALFIVKSLSCILDTASRWSGGR